MRADYRFVVVLSVALILTTAGEVLAQAAQRPFRRVFRSGPVRSPNQSLELNLSLFGSQDDNILAEQLPPEDPRFAREGTFAGLFGDLAYRREWSRVTLGLSTTSTAQYSPSLEPPLNRSHAGGINLGFELTPRTRVQIGQNVNYANYLTLAQLPLPDLTVPGLAGLPPGPVPSAVLPGPEFSLSQEDVWGYHTSAGFTHDIDRRTAVGAHYGYGRSDVSDDQRTTVQNAGASFRRALTNDAGVRFGYVYQTSENPRRAPLTFHNLDIGMDYRRSLSRSRNTTIAFSTGSAIVTRSDGNEYRLLANARLTRLMGRSWSTSIVYNRNVEFVEVLSELLSSDTVSATLGGYLSPSLQTNFSANYSRGYLGARHGRELETASAMARAQYALSRHAALDVQYTLYRYDLGPGAPLDLDAILPTRTTRHAIRAGLTFWIPFIR